MLDLKDLYQQRVASCATKFVKVWLNPIEMKFITEVANKRLQHKMNEGSYIKDSASAFKRCLNGLKGEAAIEKYLKLQVIDTDVGASIDFDVPDMEAAGYRIGIKTVDYGHFPVVPKENTYPQIICICHPNANDVVYICGLAEVDTLNKMQYDDLIIDPNLKSKGSKTGFYGFSELKEVSLDTIKPYIERPVP